MVDLLDILGQSSPTRPAAGQSLSSTADSAKDPKLATRMGAMALEGAADRQRALMQASQERQNFQKHIYRKWNTGDVYAPHDLSGVEQKKWKLARKTPSSDAFDTLGINPINEYKVATHLGGKRVTTNAVQNFTMMSEYMTEMGRIKHSRETGLRPKNQRKIAKAIRRAIGLGLMPSVHRHPLVLKKSSPSRFM
ncbi:uncharacterized protein N0V89_011270 [Didymosphaeria variabile]|uniref:Small ribosomal subunit protein bS18m n=1 Tax=Didymosphaeria variabile TaxID=1932322 RepID=A0A9W9C6Z2_9PLEO|nr:uncharacterized protein N0V89_011270 [Didymosphaeria variabile]KAJ4347329.1 hypothetical protein N0V89_011270 [Didymosphaeria variabile]